MFRHVLEFLNMSLPRIFKNTRVLYKVHSAAVNIRRRNYNAKDPCKSGVQASSLGLE